ncbi:MAG: glutamate--tRNA ligase [Pseudomonadota bacterium]|nr:glutamate--tRNA ligase [Pseudomonadota bacterium]MEC7830745.1 glutamate--tRNA ligase [Pseudomonadota bacterium]MEC9481522.1 glutamate--tRNA ligase [Pseudomonadota bacterium]
MINKKMIITRFAPSPTGFLHIGGVRTALFNWIYAKKNSGKFLLRIEDTDRKRSTDEAIDKIIDGLEWLGLSNDDEIVYQHKNQERHIEIANALLNNELAYRDWERKEDYEKLDVPHAIRFKTPKNGETIVNDKIQGEVKFNNKEIEDFVLLRSDGTPTYMLSVVVDDYDMNITDIIRGDDHFINSAKQKLIFEALNWPVPTFSHIPLIHGDDGTKLSKRHGALGIEKYRDEGYLPEAIINYLLRLGWSHGDQEIFSDKDMIELFSIEKIRKSPSRFDLDKLKDINSIYLKLLSHEELIEKLGNKFSQLNSKQSTSIKRIIPEALKRFKNINEIKENLDFLIQERPISISDDGTKLLNSSSIKTLKKLSINLKKLDKWDINEIEKVIKNFSSDEDLKFKEIGLPLRVSLVGFLSPIGIYEIIYSLGKDEVINRIEDVI